MRRLLLALGLLLLPGIAHATCPVIPFVFPATSINPLQVNDNFTSVRNCINTAIVGAGNVNGPGASAVNHCAVWNNVTGTLLKDSSCLLSGNTQELHVPRGDSANGFIDSGMTTQADIAGPANWGGIGGTYDFLRVPLNNFPLSNEFGGNNGFYPMAQAVVGAMNVPVFAVGNNTGGTGVSGYCNTASPTFNCTGVMGIGGATANGATLVTGGNFLAENSPFPQSPDGSGFSVPGGVQGIEVDVNFFHGPAGSVPANTNVYGIRVTGGSAADPSLNGGLFAGAYVATSPGIFNVPIFKWATDFWCQDGSTALCVNIGMQNESGNDNPGQFVLFGATNNVGTHWTGYQQMESTGLMHHQAPAFQFETLGAAPLLNMTATSVVIGSTDTVPSSPSLTLYWNAVNGAGAVINANSTLAADGWWNIDAAVGVRLGTAGGVDIQTNHSPGADSSALDVVVNNSSGLNLVNVTLGANDSGGVGFKVLRVPN